MRYTLLQLPIRLLLSALAGWIAVGGTLAAHSAAPDAAPLQLAQANPGLYDIEDVDYWLNRCQILQSVGQLDEAIAACERALVLNPDNEQTWLLHSQLMQQVDRPADALASTDQAIREDDRSSAAFASRCQTLLALGQYEEAIAACDQALELDRNWGTTTAEQTQLLRGDSFAANGELNGAIAIYTASLNANPQQSDTRTRRCAALNQQGHPRQAILDCEAALHANTNWGQITPLDTYRELAAAQQQIGRLEQAIATYDQALQQYPDEFSLWLEQGILLLQVGRTVESLNSLANAVLQQPTSSVALVHQCIAFNRLEEFDAALAACEQALAGDGNWGDRHAGETASLAQAWDQRATALAGLGRYEDALASINRALGFEVTAAGWNHKAAILWYLDRYPEAIAAAQQATTLDPTFMQAWFNQGLIRRSQQRYLDALVAYDTVIELAPQNGEAWANRSVALWHLHRYEEAIAAANQAIALTPDSMLGWYNRGVAQASLGQFEEAIESYDQALALDPVNADLLAGKGVVLLSLNQPQDALITLNQALAINPAQLLARRYVELAQQQIFEEAQSTSMEESSN